MTSQKQNGRIHVFTSPVFLFSTKEGIHSTKYCKGWISFAYGVKVVHTYMLASGTNEHETATQVWEKTELSPRN